MKKIRNIYSNIVSKENLYRSAYMAARGRRYRNTTADFNFRLEDELQKLQEELKMKTYKHGEYRVFTIRDPKVREIAAAPFRDRVVHHAVHDVIEPMIDRSFIYHSYACRKGKGTHRAVDTAQSFLRANRFCFHGDIRKYFPSIDHGILKGLIERRVDDKELLWLLEEIINSARQLASWPVSGLASEPVNRQTGEPENYSKGLPIGNLTSQFFANLYLNELDYFVKFDLRIHYYIRYMDDFLVFDNDKGLLQEIKNRIKRFLGDRLNLTIHEGKSQIYKTNRGIEFLGFIIFKDYRRLASDNVNRFKKRLKMFAYLLEKSGEWRVDSGEKNFTNHSSLTTLHSKISDSIRCWVAHSKYANTVGLRRDIVNRFAMSDDGFGEMIRGEMIC